VAGQKAAGDSASIELTPKEPQALRKGLARRSGEQVVPTSGQRTRIGLPTSREESAEAAPALPWVS
jgi:hypothetical protein